MVGIVAELDDPRNLSTLAFYFTLALFGVYYAFLSPSARRVYLMAFAMMAVFFLPASQIVFPVGFLVAERVLYLPSLGICLLVGALQEGLIDVIVVNGNRFFGSPSRVTSLLIAAVVVVPAVPLTVMTIHRSADWADQVKLWELAVVVNPYNHNTYFSLGEAIKDDPDRKNDSEYYLRFNKSP